MSTINLQNVLNTLNEIATIAPVISTAVGLPTVGLVTDLGTALPVIETVLTDLLALFKKHAAVISSISVTPTSAA